MCYTIVAYFSHHYQYIINIIVVLKGNILMEKPLKLKKKGEDGSRIISVRIKLDTLDRLDKVSADSNYSRNELINIILQYGLDNIEIV